MNNSHQPLVRPEYLFDDPPCPADAPIEALANYDCLDFDSHGSHIYGQIMWPGADFAKPRPCVIFYHGYPGTARYDDILNALVRIGCVTASPHHRGAWSSQGKYLITNCVEDAIAFAEHARSKEFCEKFNVDPERIYIMGHSMGGNSSVHTGAALPWLRGVILLAPFDPTYFLRHGRDDELQAVLGDGYPLSWDGVDSIVQNIKGNMASLQFDRDLEQIAANGQHLLCIVGSEDAVAPADDMVQPIWNRICTPEHPGIRPLFSVHTGHGLLGAKVSVTKEIAKFISETV